VRRTGDGASQQNAPKKKKQRNDIPVEKIGNMNDRPSREAKDKWGGVGHAIAETEGRGHINKKKQVSVAPTSRQRMNAPGNEQTYENK